MGVIKVYLVGGAVRDQLLGLPVLERDFVVVGATPEMMLAQGFKQVGKDFPVFLHPQTHEEYALARTERKIGPGYTGFTCITNPKITLEEDLKRRDLTINAIAQAEDGTIIDPYHGIDDLKNRIFRHVSEAFIEDPVRLLRIARFAARFPDFTIAPETQQLLCRMVDNHEIDALVPERVWQELHNALSEINAGRFFAILDGCNALKILFPEFTLPKLDKILAKLADSKFTTIERWAAITYLLPSRSSEMLAHRLRIPKAYLKLSKILQKIASAKPANIEAKLFLLEQLDFIRHPQLLVTAAALLPAIHPQSSKLCQELIKICDYIRNLHIDTADLANIPAAQRSTALHQRRLAHLINSSRT